MSTKTMKILTFIATVLIALAMLSTVVFAAVDSDGVINQMQKENINVSQSQQLSSLGGKILSALQVIGFIAGAVILVVLGLKYMMGSLEEKAEYKKTMIPYLVGAIIVIAAPTLAKGIFSMIQSLGQS